MHPKPPNFTIIQFMTALFALNICIIISLHRLSLKLMGHSLLISKKSSCAHWGLHFYFKSFNLYKCTSWVFMDYMSLRITSLLCTIWTIPTYLRDPVTSSSCVDLTWKKSFFFGLHTCPNSLENYSGNFTFVPDFSTKFHQHWNNTSRAITS